MFSDFPEQTRVTQLLQHSLERSRLAHAYLFTGNSIDELEAMARTLAKTLNCQSPSLRSPGGITLDSCDQCDSCRRIDGSKHPDVLWIRPESKSRVVTIDQMRELMQTMNLKPTVAEFKVGVIVEADRLNIAAANAFLKTLEEPPPKSILILLTRELQRVLETIQSRCLRLNFVGEGTHFESAQVEWLSVLGTAVAAGTDGLLSRYRLLGLIMKKLGEQKEQIETMLGARSPLAKYEELDGKMKEKLEDELTAAIEAEYRRQRTYLIDALHWWLRDAWLQTLNSTAELLTFPNLASTTRTLAGRLSPTDALSNLEVIDRLQRLLHTNVQEALALEVGLLKLKL